MAVIKPANIDDEEWRSLYAAFRVSHYRQVIEQLCASSNSPIKASVLFEGLDVARGEDFVNQILQGLPYRLRIISGKRTEPDRELALVAA